METGPLGLVSRSQLGRRPPGNNVIRQQRHSEWPLQWQCGSKAHWCRCGDV